MTATETEPVSADQANNPTGLTLEEHSTILDAMTVVLAVTQEAARRTLQAERPALEAEVTLAEQRASEALTAAEPGRETVARLEAELEACQQRAAELQAASDDDDLSVRLDARTWRLAVEQETEALQGRLQRAHRAADPAANTLRQAENDLNRARAELASLDAAIELPFAHPRGQATEAHRVYSLRTGLWAESDGETARSIVDDYLRRSGYGADLERNAIRAYLAGDPRARSAGDVKHFADHTLINTGEVPVVAHGAAQPGSLDGRPPVPTQAPSGAEISQGARAGQWPAQQASSVTKAAEPIEQVWQIPSAISRVWR